MGNAMYTGISGLNASSKQLEVIGDNLANMSTVGFKASTMSFSDLLSQTVAQSSGLMQIGRGVAVHDVSTQFSIGSFETTTNATDLAINGDGFFWVQNSNGESFYTRAGAFHVNSAGYLVDSNGYYVQGYSGTNLSTLGDLNVTDAMSDPSATTSFTLGANLNSDTATGGTFYASQTVYDSLGTARSLSLVFQKTEGDGYWGVSSTLDSGDETAPTLSYSGLLFDSDGALSKIYSSSIGTPTITTAGDGTATATINKQGQLYKDSTEITLTRGASATEWTITGNGGYSAMSVTGTSSAVTIDLDGAGGTDITFALSDTWASGDTIQFTIAQTEVTPADITLTFGTLSNSATIGSSGVVTWDCAGSTAKSLTGYASTSIVNTTSQDGHAAGTLSSISITEDGSINGYFTNGETETIGQVVLAKFADQGGLSRVGSNLFQATVQSGDAITDVPGNQGLGEVLSNSLEMANTDISTEFVRMITAQRAYQANAKVITTMDSMLSELMAIKR